MADRNLALQLLITAKDEASALFGKIFKSLNDNTNVIANKIRESFTGIFSTATTSAADFEEQLGKVQAKGDDTYRDTAKLKKGLEEIAAQFGVTGTEAAQGMEVLAAAGLNATDAMKALPPVLNLAQMENLSLDAAATKLVDSLSIMGMEFSQAGKMADVLAKGANISTASAASLAEALSGVGGQALAAGMDLETTVAALDMLHKSGIKGSAAGTSLAAILTQLQNPSSQASKELSKLGISSRDLGSVLDGLNAAGVKSNTAILAFGETAGPGLRAMLGQGSAGLNDFTKQLRNSDGAAQTAADQLSNNFNTALKALGAAWDSLKSALAEPILKPIADGARDVAKAINEALSKGALKPAQEAIKTFAEQGVAAVREFVKNFDFQQATKALGDFLTSARESFAGIKDAGNTAADAVMIAWNAVTAGFKTIGAGLLEIAAKTLSGLAAMEEAASKVGLGTIERANDLRKTASSMEAQAAELIQSVAKDSTEMGAAYDRMVGKTDAATAAQERLKQAMPVAEIQQLTYTLKDYQTIADRANAVAEQARIAYEAGKIGAQEYGQKLMEAADANAALNDATAAQSAATEKAAAAIAETKNQIAEYDRQIKAGNANAAEWREGMELNGVKMLGLRDAATATAEKLAYLQSIKATLPDADRQIAQATAEATAAQNRYNQAIAENVDQQEKKLDAVKRGNDLATKDYDLKLQQIEAEKELALAKGDTETATRKENEAIDLQNQKIQASIDGKQREIEAYQNLIEATRLKLAADGELNFSDQAQLATMADTLRGMEQEKTAMEQARESTERLTAAKREKEEADKAAAKAAKEAAEAEKEAADQRAAAGDAVNSNWTAANKVLAETGGNMEILNKAFIANQEAATRSSIGWVDWATKTAWAADHVAESYRNQKSAVDGAVETLQRFVSEGGNVTEIQRLMAQYGERAIQEFGLLDQQDLSNLQDAIDAANGKLRDMQQEAEDARLALDEMNAEIMAEQGNTAGSERLKLQIEQSQKLAELEQKRMEAEMTGNKEAEKYYKEMIKNVDVLYNAKTKNLEAELAANEASKDSAKSFALVQDASSKAADSEKAAGDAIKSRSDATTLSLSTATTKIGDLDSALKTTNTTVAVTNGSLEGTAKNLDQLADQIADFKIDAAIDSLSEFAKEGGDAAEAERLIALYGNEASSELRSLDQVTLDKINSAIESANQKLHEMQQEAQDAQAALAEMNAELMAEAGDTAGAERLKLQIEQSQKLAELERLRMEAEMTGNKAAAAAYDEMIRKLPELYALKNENLKADLAAQAANDKTQKTAKSAAGGVGELATALERASSAAQALNQNSLADLTNQVNSLSTEVNKLHGLL